MKFIDSLEILEYIYLSVKIKHSSLLIDDNVNGGNADYKKYTVAYID